MQHQELLDTFTSLVDQYEQHQGFIDRAQSQANKFKPEIIEKVVRDHTAKANEVAQEVGPHLTELRQASKAIDGERESVAASRDDHQTKLEELELRQAIGELDDASFKSEAEDIQSQLDEIQVQLDALTSEFEALSSADSRWAELHGEGMAPIPEPEPEPEPEPVVPEPEPEMEPDPEPINFDDVVEDDEIDEIVSDVGDEDVEIKWDSEPEDMEDIADEIIDEPLDEIPEDDLGGTAGDEDSDAFLLYQEGTPEEQTYPIEAEVLTIGRSRTNDVQVKNDSKVSRVHAKVFRREGAFYIEDNKSSNGTLVNGELITERRLFGGEELIIGETFFRFQMGTP